MFGIRGMVLWAAVVVLGVSLGCSSGSDDAGVAGSGGVTGSYAGTWTGNVCGRGLTLTLVQNGVRLEGSYQLTNPTFSEPVDGTVSSLTPPATSTLTALGGRKFEITFTSYTSLNGGFYNPVLVCDVNAAR